MPLIVTIHNFPAISPAEGKLFVDTQSSVVTRYRHVRLIIYQDNIRYEKSFIMLAGNNGGDIADIFKKMFDQFFPNLIARVLNNEVHIKGKDAGSVINSAQVYLKGQIEPRDPPGWVIWPANLPRCATAWAESPIDPRIRTTMDAGREKTRRRATGLQRKIAVSFVLLNNDGGANEQFIAMRDFFEVTGDTVTHQGGTNGGQSWFLFQSPVDELFHFYRFITPPNFANTGPLSFKVTMEWEEYL